jgi:hypothetical protein
MYSLFNLNIRAVIYKLADRIIETLNIQAGTDRIDDKQVDSNDELTLDFIEVKVPALLESRNNSAEQP